MSAIVTGGAQGIGLSISRALLRNAYKVALLDFNPTVGELACEGLKKEFGKDSVLFVHCDVTNEKQLTSAYKESVRKFGGLDVVCNNAGIGDEVNYKKTVAVNLTAVISSSLMAFEYMSTNKGGKGGVIVNISSAAGFFPQSSAPVYTATKQGVIGYTKSIEEWYSTDGIRVNCVCPAFTDTALFRKSISHVDSQFAEDLVASLGVMSTDYVAEAVLRTIQDSSLNGILLLVRRRDGLNIVEVNMKKVAKL
jgi:15-hydroxyprostaglandin dehydrogenase (NAD)